MYMFLGFLGIFMYFCMYVGLYLRLGESREVYMYIYFV